LAFFEDSQPGLSRDELDEVARDAGIPLPPSLRELYGTLGDGRFRFGLFIDEEETYYDLHEVISARSTKLSAGFAGTYRDIVLSRKLVPEHLVPFAVESGGNFYCIDRNDESVWYADMELSRKGTLPSPTRLSDSLDAFLRACRERE
jgi:hypothetical protein